MFELIRHYLLSLKRSPLFEAKLVPRIFTLIIFGQSAIGFIFIGFFLNNILMQIKPDVAPIDFFSRIILFPFVVDIILKFFFKSYKYVDVLPYLTLPVSRKKIYALLFAKELLSGWNFLWVIMLTPFFFKTVYPGNGLLSVFLLIFSVYFVSVTISFIIRYIDVMSTWKSSLFSFFPLLLAMCVGYVAYYIAVSPNLLIDLHLVFTQYNLWVSIGLCLLFLCLFIVFLKSCRTELYAHLTGKKRFAVSFNPNLNTVGLTGEIVKLCLREITRSQLKRNVFICFLFIIGGLMILHGNNSMTFHDNDNWNFYLKCFIILMPTLMFGSTFGDYSFGAESTFFDKLMITSENIPYLILKIKYSICVIFFALISIIYTIKLPVLFCVSVFFGGSGIVLFFIFRNAAYNQQRFDILGSVRKMTNFTFQSILSMIFIVLSFCIILLIKRLTSEITATYVMLIAGMIMTITSPFWLKNTYKNFLLRKYQNMSGFRDIACND